MSRPSYKELHGKLRLAKQAVRDGNIALLNPLALSADAIELGFIIGSELSSVLAELLDDTSPNDYTGRRPPDRSYEQEIKGVELFAFAIESKRFKCRVYYKFAFVDEALWLVSLHQDRPMKEGQCKT